MMAIAERLSELEIELPEAAVPVGAYRPVVVSGSLAFVAGQIPMAGRTVLSPGRVGRDISVDQAASAARRCALQALSALELELGTLDRIQQIVKLEIFVAGDPDLTEHALVGNGASEVLRDIFGDAGVHSRVAVGVASLPLGACVEVVMVAQRD